MTRAATSTMENTRVIDVDKLKSLIELMVEHGLSEVDLRDDQQTVVLKRPIAGGVMADQPIVQVAAPPVATAAAPAPAAEPGAAAPADDDAGLEAIVSPMVGTFYSAPDPESAPFASVGSRVGPDSVVCIVEAMKVFSEIKAEVAGVVERVLVKNGDPVEFGQKLFMVRPAG
ncbi:MAG: acetyl-CoA carboxylase biotin carboxyl carrier protein [Planctomycetota bacterium]